ncbi:unnamed protein product [Cuscuta epithymum]|uniref:Uncharacterized protein n=1 Tax=Cuscuta epithymum TaxID=186058 RepID=A0AAV0ECG7_9ASTE|nr:unnamed protein product [Cuscuta epithymum]
MVFQPPFQKLEHPHEVIAQLYFSFRILKLFLPRVYKWDFLCISHLFTQLVKSFACVALATRFDSDLKLYPKSERATQLAEWALSNTIQIKATILQEDYHDSASKLFDLKPEPIVPITDMLHVSGQGSISCIVANVKIKEVPSFY